MPNDLSDALRYLRATFLAGGIWLCAIWLVFGNHLIHAAQRQDLRPLLAPLPHVFGQAGAAAAISITAFAVGALSLQIFRAPAIWITNVVSIALVATEFLVIGLIKVLSRTYSPVRRYDQWKPMAVDLARRLIHNHGKEILTLAGGDQSKADALRKMAYARADRVIAYELRSPDSEQCYVRLLYERACAQLGLVVPVIALGLSLGWRVSGSCYFIVLAAGTIGFGAVDYRRDLEGALDESVWPSVLEALSAGWSS